MRVCSGYSVHSVEWKVHLHSIIMTDITQTNIGMLYINSVVHGLQTTDGSNAELSGIYSIWRE